MLIGPRSGGAGRFSEHDIRYGIIIREHRIKNFLKTCPETS